jgi:hypothetical protein
MIDKKLVSGKAYSLPTAEIVKFDFEDVIRTSEEATTKEVAGDYASTGWDTKLGGLN